MKIITTTILPLLLTCLCLTAAAFSASAQSIKVKKASTKSSSQGSSASDSASSSEKHSWLPAASGAQYVNEFQTSYSNGSFSTTKVGTQSFTIISITGSYARLIKEKIQVGAEAGFNNTSGGSSSTTFTVMGFGTYHFNEDFQTSFYGKGGLGLFNVVNASGANESKFGLMVGGGRRFPIWDRINYNPEVRLYKKGDADPNFEIQFLNLSILY